MLDIGWTELLVVAVVLIVVVGPKDLPPMIRAFGKMTRRLRQTAGEFRSQFDEALREAELDDLKSSVNDIRSLNPANTIRDTLNPLRQMGQDIRSDLERSTRYEPKTSDPADFAAEDEAVTEPSILPETPLTLRDAPQELRAASPAAPVAAAPHAVAPATSAPAVGPVEPAAKLADTQLAAPGSAKDAASTPAKTSKARKPAAAQPAKKTASELKAPAKTAKPAAAKPATRTRKPKNEDLA